MSGGPWDEALNRALDARDPDTTAVDVAAGTSRARVDVVEADRLGVRVRGVTVERGEAEPVDGAAERLASRVRSLPERLVPVEVDPGLGGAVLRSRPDEMRGRDFYQLEVDAEGRRGVTRQRPSPGGGREATDWTMTRDQLGRLLDELDG